MTVAPGLIVMGSPNEKFSMVIVGTLVAAVTWLAARVVELEDVLVAALEQPAKISTAPNATTQRNDKERNNMNTLRGSAHVFCLRSERIARML